MRFCHNQYVLCKAVLKANLSLGQGIPSSFLKCKRWMTFYRLKNWRFFVMRFSYSTRIKGENNTVKWFAYSRWSFGSNSTWGSIETTTIGKTHPTLRLQCNTWSFSGSITCDEVETAFEKMQISKEASKEFMKKLDQDGNGQDKFHFRWLNIEGNDASSLWWHHLSL